MDKLQPRTAEALPKRKVFPLGGFVLTEQALPLHTCEKDRAGCPSPCTRDSEQNYNNCAWISDGIERLYPDQALSPSYFVRVIRLGQEGRDSLIPTNNRSKFLVQGSGFLCVLRVFAVKNIPFILSSCLNFLGWEELF